MKSSLVRTAFLLMALGLSSSACDNGESMPLSGNILQPEGSAIVGSRLFVASPVSNAIHVLDIGGEAAFVRAPNPLAALEIPAVRRPSVVHGIAGDEDDGRRGIAIVLSGIDDQARVLDADAMVPLGLPLALAGRPVAVGHASGGTIFIAVAWPELTGQPGALMVIELIDDVWDSEGAVGEDESPALSVEVLPVDVVPGGLAVADPDGEPVVWMSSVDTAEALRIDPATGDADVVRTGEPIGMLHASPEATSEPVRVPQGRFIYGITASGGGILALDERERGVAAIHEIDGEVRPMPLPGYGVSLTTALRALVDVGQEGDREAIQVPFLLLVTLIDGSVLYVDGGRMVPIDDYGRSAPEPTYVLEPSADADGEGTGLPALESEENPEYVEGGQEPRRIPLVEVTPGVTRTRTWRVAWRGEIPGQAPALGTVAADMDGVAVLPLMASTAVWVAAGDRLTIVRWFDEEPPAGCEVYTEAPHLTWEIEEVDGISGGMTLAVLEGGPPLPSEDCFDETVTYRVRAGDYLVTASGLDSSWRVRPGDTFEHRGEPFMQLDPPVEGPEIRFTLAEVQHEDDMVEGVERRLHVSDGFERVRAVPDVAGLQVPPASMPGQPAAFRPDTSRYGTGRLFLPYSGPGYIFSFDLRTRGDQRFYR